MASLNPVNAPPPTPTAPADGAVARTARAQDRRLRLEDILKLMVAEGLVTAADADRLARSRTHRFEHPLEMIADQKWRSLAPPRSLMTLEWLVEWLAGKLGVSYHHIDPLKIDLVAVTSTMSNAYAERYRILPVAVRNGELTVATSEPFVRAWAEELEKILHLKIRLVFANPLDIKRYLGEFFTLARSIKKAAAAGRPDQDRIAGRPGNRAAHLHHADGFRRENRDADLHARSADPRFPGTGLYRGGLHALGQDDPRAQRHRPRHRPDRLGQDD